MLVSIIIPAYNQEKTIKKDIEMIDKVMSQTRWDYEIIVVNDGSSDNTFSESKKLSKKNILAIGYEKNHGKGYAIRYGMAKSKGDYIVFIDSGMDLDPNGISMILEHMEWYDADIMVGSKRHPVSKVNYPFMRKVYSIVYYLLVKILFGLQVKDTQVGLKVFRRPVLEKVLPRLLIKRFAFDIEILAVSRRLGFKRVFEAPIRLTHDFSNTNFSYMILFDKNIRSMLIDTIAVFYRLRILKYYDDNNKRKWVYDKDLEMRINTGESSN